MLESIFLLIVLWILGTIFLPILSAHLVFRHLKSCFTVMSLCLTICYIINFLLFVIWIQTHLVPVFLFIFYFLFIFFCSFLWTVRMYVSVVCATFASCCASLYNKPINQSKKKNQMPSFIGQTWVILDIATVFIFPQQQLRTAHEDHRDAEINWNRSLLAECSVRWSCV